MKVRFLSSNRFKIEEASSILAEVGVEVIPISEKIEELQTTDVSALVRDKCLKAFAKIGRPLFVEHTGLYIDALNGFPGGLTQVFWDTLQADRVASLFGSSANTQVTAKTIVAYCDGRFIKQFEGEIRGSFASAPRGDRSFQWDCVFVPSGHELTFAEMGKRKNDISMRRIAINQFAEFLKDNRHA